MKRRFVLASLAAATALGLVSEYFATSHTVAQPAETAVNLRGADGPTGTARAESAGSPAPSGNPLWTIALSQLSLTRNRPIFSPSRRPPPATPFYVASVAPRPSPKPAEPERPAIALVGTVAGGSGGIGVFVETATRNALRLRLGEDHQGWILHAVKARGVTLEKNGQTAVLELPPPGGEAAVMANVPAPDEQRAARRPARR